MPESLKAVADIVIKTWMKWRHDKSADNWIDYQMAEEMYSLEIAKHPEFAQMANCPE